MHVTSTILRLLTTLLLGLAVAPAWVQLGKFNGLSTALGNLYRLSDAKTRSISPEDFTGGKGRGSRATEGTGKNADRDLGPGWQHVPFPKLPSKDELEISHYGMYN